MKEPPYYLVKVHLTKVILDPEMGSRQLILQDNSYNDGTLCMTMHYDVLIFTTDIKYGIST